MDEEELQKLVIQKATEDPFVWMCSYVKINEEPYAIDNWWFQEEICSNTSRKVFVKKCAQGGLSLIYLSQAIWFCENRRENVLYTLPSSEDAKEFSKTKLEDIINESQFIRMMIESSINKRQDNASIKKIRKNYLYIRGMSGGRGKLESISVGAIFLDEYSKIEEHQKISLAKKRHKASKNKWERYFSISLYPDDLIDRGYKKGNQKMWFIQCEYCKHEQSPDFFKHHNLFHKDKSIKELPPCYICENCSKKLNVLAKGKWIAQNPDGKYDSYWITGTYVPDYDELGEVCDSANTLWESWEDAQENPDELPEFYRQNLGTGYLSANDKIDPSEIEACIRAGGGYLVNDVDLDDDQTLVLGVDVGTYLHYVLLDVSDPINHKTIDFGKFNGLNKFEQLEKYIEDTIPDVTVIDMYPEVTEAGKITESLSNHAIYLARENSGLNIMTMAEKKKEKNDLPIILYNKTISFDITFGKIKSEKIHLPKDTPEEWKKHVMNVVRVKSKDRYKYVGRTGSKLPDHYLSATVFAEIAFMHLRKKRKNSGKLIIV
ncbi:MAG: hypothetical protein GY870_11265 [archaeon]|nr:hypothetical protein [archaeon]